MMCDCEFLIEAKISTDFEMKTIKPGDIFEVIYTNQQMCLITIKKIARRKKIDDIASILSETK
jgi:TusA-related sulfurtransferase